MAIKVILWDIDGTLLNFEKTEKYALQTCFSRFSLGECTDDRISRYSEINKKYWERLEKGELTKEEVLKGRFAEFFQTEGIFFSKIEEFNKEYLTRLGDEIFFQDEGYELVKRLKEKVKQYAVTNGTYAAQHRKLKKSGLDVLFDDIFISDLIGFEKPSRDFFDYVWKKTGFYDKEEVMIVGDSLTSDMQGGNNAGILCCWYNRKGAGNPGRVKIDYEIQDLRQVEEIVSESISCIKNILY